MKEHSPRIRILHIFKRMDPGGAETWILNVMRAMDRGKYQFDFLVETGPKGTYDEEIRHLGGRIIYGPPHARPLEFAFGLYRILRTSGPYNVIHSHVHHFSGLTLAIARLAGVPVRIAHSHSDLAPVIERATLPRRLYYWATGKLVRNFATVGIGVSNSAARSLFGDSWQSDERFRVIFCGIDCDPFRHEIDRSAVRAQYGIGNDTLVVGHVGRFAAMKNHEFLLDVFRSVASRRPDSRLALVGDGPLRDQIQQKAEKLGIDGKVLMLGVQSDVSWFLRGIVDVFVFPSSYEGLGLAVVEAQAAGLPCIVSDSVPSEADVVPDIVDRLSLSAGKDSWASLILSRFNSGVGRQQAYKTVCKSAFNISQSVESVMAVYDLAGVQE